ncbi:hypothetical protein M9H77_03015 [Catharanthus roseus]|uniref:Uncharacterized protein n=1 Tax=Catharanthus roseus TaxID=4058 RepID=A0ACC0CA07_CATRO|nr:hypothetical protein M9H77_03015 [Catharanthus roseus]
MSASLKKKRVKKKSKDNKRIEDKERNMEKELGDFLKDLPISLSLNSSLMFGGESIVRFSDFSFTLKINFELSIRFHHLICFVAVVLEPEDLIFLVFGVCCIPPSMQLSPKPLGFLESGTGKKMKAVLVQNKIAPTICTLTSIRNLEQVKY